MKQESLAHYLGISQQAVSRMEKSETIDDEKLEQVAKALGVSKEAIRNFNEDTVIFNIENMNDSSANYQYHFNPLEKVVELYERLLQAEKEKNEALKLALQKNSSIKDNKKSN